MKFEALGKYPTDRVVWEELPYTDVRTSSDPERLAGWRWYEDGENHRTVTDHPYQEPGTVWSARERGRHSVPFIEVETLTELVALGRTRVLLSHGFHDYRGWSLEFDHECE